eukprot:00423_6
MTGYLQDERLIGTGFRRSLVNPFLCCMSTQSAGRCGGLCEKKPLYPPQVERHLWVSHWMPAACFGQRCLENLPKSILSFPPKSSLFLSAALHHLGLVGLGEDTYLHQQIVWRTLTNISPTDRWKCVSCRILQPTGRICVCDHFQEHPKEQFYGAVLEPQLVESGGTAESGERQSPPLLSRQISGYVGSFRQVPAGTCGTREDETSLSPLCRQGAAHGRRCLRVEADIYGMKSLSRGRFAVRLLSREECRRALLGGLCWGECRRAWRSPECVCGGIHRASSRAAGNPVGPCALLSQSPDRPGRVYRGPSPLPAAQGRFHLWPCAGDPQSGDVHYVVLLDNQLAHCSFAGGRCSDDHDLEGRGLLELV